MHPKKQRIKEILSACSRERALLDSSWIGFLRSRLGDKGVGTSNLLGGDPRKHWWGVVMGDKGGKDME